jgi:tetratricopeptide (TPR) repeat protein
MTITPSLPSAETTCAHGGKAGRREPLDNRVVSDRCDASLAAQRFAEWQRNPTDLSLAAYQQAEQDVMRLAPSSRTAWAQSGRRLAEIYNVTQDEEHLRGALAAHRRATELYPHNAFVRAELAGVLLAAGHSAEARDHAREALRQDDITRQAGHADKLLPDEQRGQMQRIVSQPESDTVN